MRSSANSFSLVLILLAVAISSLSCKTPTSAENSDLRSLGASDAGGQYMLFKGEGQGAQREVRQYKCPSSSVAGDADPASKCKFTASKSWQELLGLLAKDAEVKNSALLSQALKQDSDSIFTIIEYQHVFSATDGTEKDWEILAKAMIRAFGGLSDNPLAVLRKLGNSVQKGQKLEEASYVGVEGKCSEQIDALRSTPFHEGYPLDSTACVWSLYVTDDSLLVTLYDEYGDALASEFYSRNNDTGAFETSSLSNQKGLLVDLKLADKKVNLNLDGGPYLPFNFLAKGGKSTRKEMLAGVFPTLKKYQGDRVRELQGTFFGNDDPLVGGSIEFTTSGRIKIKTYARALKVDQIEKLGYYSLDSNNQIKAFYLDKTPARPDVLFLTKNRCFLQFLIDHDGKKHSVSFRLSSLECDEKKVPRPAPLASGASGSTGGPVDCLQAVQRVEANYGDSDFRSGNRAQEINNCIGAAQGTDWSDRMKKFYCAFPGIPVRKCFTEGVQKRKTAGASQSRAYSEQYKSCSSDGSFDSFTADIHKSFKAIMVDRTACQ